METPEQIRERILARFPGAEVNVVTNPGPAAQHSLLVGAAHAAAIAAFFVFDLKQYFSLDYFKSQRAGRAPHSPKNCLPGNGWVKEKNSIITVQVPGRAEPIEAQYYLVQRGESKSVVIYWYQSHGRVVADEYTAKYFVVADAIRYNRTDTALVKFTVPAGPEGAERASEIAIDAVKEFFPAVAAALPN